MIISSVYSWPLHGDLLWCHHFISLICPHKSHFKWDWKIRCSYQQVLQQWNSLNNPKLTIYYSKCTCVNFVVLSVTKLQFIKISINPIKKQYIFQHFVANCFQFDLNSQNHQKAQNSALTQIQHSTHLPSKQAYSIIHIERSWCLKLWSSKHMMVAYF